MVPTCYGRQAILYEFEGLISMDGVYAENRRERFQYPSVNGEPRLTQIGRWNVKRAVLFIPVFYRIWMLAYRTSPAQHFFRSVAVES